MDDRWFGLRDRGRYHAKEFDLDQLRPEYIDAVNAAVWNHWFLLAILIPPFLLLPPTWLRFHSATIFVVFLASVVLCWLCFGMGVQHIWDIKELNAQTTAERADVTADTAKLFAPVVIGVPFAICYNLIVQLIALLVRGIFSWALRDKRPTKKPVAKNV